MRERHRMVVHLAPRFYGTAVSRFESSPIYNLDFLLALHHNPPIPRDIYLHDEGTIVIEQPEGMLPRVFIGASSSPAAKALLECIPHDEVIFIIRERWLSMLIEGHWDVEFVNLEEARYTTDSNRFSGESQIETIELDVSHDRLAMALHEEREDTETNPPLEDLIVWKGRGRKSRLFASLVKFRIASYVSVLPVSNDLAHIWQIQYAFTSPTHRRQGCAKAALCCATQSLLADGAIPLIITSDQRVKGSCMAMGYRTEGERLQGRGKRIATPSS